MAKKITPSMGRNLKIIKIYNIYISYKMPNFKEKLRTYFYSNLVLRACLIIVFENYYL